MTPEYQAARQARLLRPAPAVHQPRGLLGEADALVLGRLLRAARVQGRGRHRRELWASREATQLAAMRDEFRRDLYASIAAARWRSSSIDYIPGSVELGDFDATSTTIARQPGRRARAACRSPRWIARSTSTTTNFVGAARRHKPWEAYTPYELRTVGTFVRLGPEAARARAARFLLQGPAARGVEPVGRGRLARSARRPSSSATCRTRGWARTTSGRVSTCSRTSARAIQSLVIGAGVPDRWVTADAGSARSRLSTHYGPLELHDAARERMRVG